MSKTFLKLVIPESDDRKPPPCTKEDPELFFPTSESAEYQRQIAEAKAVCRKCPMATKLACLEFALETEDKHAILGGTTPSERFTIRNKRIARAEKAAAQRERKLNAA